MSEHECVRACVGGWVGGWVGAWVRACVRACVGGWVGGWVSEVVASAVFGFLASRSQSGSNLAVVVKPCWDQPFFGCSVNSPRVLEPFLVGIGMFHRCPSWGNRWLSLEPPGKPGPSIFQP